MARLLLQVVLTLSCVVFTAALAPAVHLVKLDEDLPHQDTPVVQVNYHHKAHKHLSVDLNAQELASMGVQSTNNSTNATKTSPFTPEKACPKGCLQHGSCDFSTGVCTCHIGWHGPDCLTPYKCTDQCNYHGHCVGDNKCVCAPHFGGEACEIDFRCVDDCSGHGTCVNGGTECICGDGWEGEICETKSVPMFQERVWEQLFPPASVKESGSRPEARHSHVSVANGDSSTTSDVLIWGGLSANKEPLDDMWLFHAASSQWTRIAQRGIRPGPRYDAAATIVQGSTMFMFGGFEPCDDDATAFSNDLWAWSLETESWSRVPMALETGLTSGPPGRVGHSLVTVGDSIFLFGGKGAQSVPLSDLWRFSTVSRKWQSLAAAPFGSRSFHAAFSHSSSSFHVFGGLDADSKSHNDLFEYDIGANAWTLVTTLGTKPSERNKHNIIVRSGSAFSIGGISANSGNSDIFKLDLDTMSWSQPTATGSVPGVGGGSPCVLVASRVVMFGGQTASGPIADVYLLDLDAIAWSKPATVGDLPIPRMLASGNVIEDKLWIFGGETTSGKRLDDLWDFDLDTKTWTIYSQTAVAAADSAAVYKCGAASTDTSGVVVEESQVAWPAARSAHATTVISGNDTLCNDYDTLVMFGGLDIANKARNDLWYWCGGSQQWTEVAVPPTDDIVRPPARSNAAIVFVGKNLFVFGGMTTDRARLNDLWSCSLGNGMCNAVSAEGSHKPHTRRSMHLHAFLPHDQLLVFGGYWREKNACSTCAGVVRALENDRTIDVWKYQTAYSRWKKVNVKDAPEQRHCPGSFVSGNKLVMFGGFAVDGIVEHNDMWYLNLEAVQWRRLPVKDNTKSPTGRHEHTFDVWHHNSKTFAVVFGGLGLAGILHDIWVTEISDVVVASDWAKVGEGEEGRVGAHVKHVVV